MTEIKEVAFLRQIVTSLRIVVVTMIVCCILYPVVILIIGQNGVPYTANGSMLENEHGEIIGSEQMAQPFTNPGYFWPRPSAVNYNGAATGGSNWSPTNPAIKEQAQKIIQAHSISVNGSIPADLVTASGSGMDPHITLRAAQYQAPRVAKARGIALATVQDIIDRHVNNRGAIFDREPLINVLLVNMELMKTDSK